MSYRTPVQDERDALQKAVDALLILLNKEKKLPKPPVTPATK